MALAAAMFPPDHPYHWLTLGRADDLRAATLAEAHEFFRTYYHPANASLALAGDIDTEQAFAYAERYFGELPAGPAPTPVRAGARLTSRASLVLEDRVEAPRLYVGWHTPAIFAPDDAELDLAADVLAHGKTSRLYRSLVYEQRVATDVTASQYSRELSGTFTVTCTASAGVSLTALDEAIRDAVAALSATGPSESELAGARAQTEARFVYRLQKIGDFGGKSDQLNAYNVFCGDPGYFTRDLERYWTTDGARIAAATRRWLHESPSVSLAVVPAGRRELALPDAAEARVS
jgi:zinc protease